MCLLLINNYRLKDKFLLPTKNLQSLAWTHWKYSGKIELRFLTVHRTITWFQALSLKRMVEIKTKLYNYYYKFYDVVLFCVRVCTWINTYLVLDYILFWVQGEETYNWDPNIAFPLREQRVGLIEQWIG